jgi:hypothetical protein
MDGIPPPSDAVAFDSAGKVVTLVPNERPHS